MLDKIKRGHRHFVAVSAGDVVGWCDVTPNERPIYAHGGILGMGLLPQFRRQGIGTNLIRSALGAARSIGLRRVELRGRENNTGAIELYKKSRLSNRGFAT
ncbi:N-acetyltransferase family protein [Bradyrhizobium sp.]|uniref:GNAT family N-acetyltransferase n=1 Tax=Bradyrhizobium sp. TaxID=376 RepID=UPI003C7276B9